MLVRLVRQVMQELRETLGLQDQQGYKATRVLPGKTVQCQAPRVLPAPAEIKVMLVLQAQAVT